MSSKDDAYRESQMRLHRVLGTYLALVAWKRKADGVVINRESLLSFLKISRMQNVRVDWMKEDLAHLFPYTIHIFQKQARTQLFIYLGNLFPKEYYIKL
mgnify:CR=1 FL=1